MRTYTVKKISGTPNWDSIEKLPVDRLLWTESCDIRVWAQVCWSDQGLYIRQTAQEPIVRAELQGPLERVCNDSCMEFFLRPTEALHYFNFEFNPNASLYLGFRTGRENAVRLIPEKYLEQFDPKTARTADGWELTYHVPFAFIQLFFPGWQAEPGKKMYANFYKCGDETPNPHYLAWNPIRWDTPEFHRPEQFGTLILGE